jgi:hypothetical protein
MSDRNRSRSCELDKLPRRKYDTDRGCCGIGNGKHSNDVDKDCGSAILHRFCPNQRPVFAIYDGRQSKSML